MRIFLKYVDGFELGTGEASYLGLWEERIQAFREKGFSLAANPQESEVVMVIESARYKCFRYAQTLLNDPVIVSHWGKVLTINYDDNPAGFLPGLYANLPSFRFVPDFHEPFCYLFAPRIPDSRLNEIIPLAAPSRLLFSFRGAASHAVRRALIDLFATSSGSWKVTHIDRWYNHSPAETDAYYAEVLDSAFVLCPRGISTATHRLFEVMAMGRCPVIISDDWVPIPGPDWSECSVRIPELSIRDIPGILKKLEPRAAELGVRARQVWERYFSYQARFEGALQRLDGLRQRIHRPTLAQESARWASGAFQRANLWDWRSRLGRGLRRAIGFIKVPRAKR